jgi:hypothetical protein
VVNSSRDFTVKKPKKNRQHVGLASFLIISNH